MIIGVPKEIKIGEKRVSMTPSLCRRVTSLGARVIMEKHAGVTAGFTDDEYKAAGATFANSAEKVWKSADMILKVKEPLEAEFDLMQQGQTIFTYLHLAAGPALAKQLCKKGILGIAYETVESSD
ncbi:MAG: alanine dehydrogenase, partial [Opitutus sp.]|nr:alanine dehydrogenase [Opitutus sp.]